MRMLDYVQLAHVRMGENLERSSELVCQLVDIFQSGSFSALRIVASGSSRHAADCARDYLQEALQMQVSVVTPEAFVDFEHTFPCVCRYGRQVRPQGKPQRHLRRSLGNWNLGLR